MLGLPGPLSRSSSPSRSSNQSSRQSTSRTVSSPPPSRSSSPYPSMSTVKVYSDTNEATKNDDVAKFLIRAPIGTPNISHYLLGVKINSQTTAVFPLVNDSDKESQTLVVLHLNKPAPSEIKPKYLESESYKQDVAPVLKRLLENQDDSQLASIRGKLCLGPKTPEKGEFYEDPHAITLICQLSHLTDNS